MTRVVILDPLTPDRLEAMRPYLPDGWTIATAASRAHAHQIAALHEAAFAITGDVPITADMMSIQGLRAIHKWGVGYDNIDLDAARLHGVRVLRTTGSNAVAVAETTLGLILALNRNIVRGHVGIARGEWRKGELSGSSTTLSDKTVGIVGLGHIGKALAGLLRGFGCEILYSKRSPLPRAEEVELGVRFAALDDLLARSDVVTLNCELNASTRGLIDRQRLALMKTDAILVNAARGGVVVEPDLADALASGRLRGAAVDVFETEPIEAENPLLGLDRVILTPHLGAITSGSLSGSFARMMANLHALHDGREPNGIDLLV